MFELRNTPGGAITIVLQNTHNATFTCMPTLTCEVGHKKPELQCRVTGLKLGFLPVDIWNHLHLQAATPEILPNLSVPMSGLLDTNLRKAYCHLTLPDYSFFNRDANF